MEQTVRTLPVEVLMPEICRAVEAGGSFPLLVTGASMHPTLHAGRDGVVLTAPGKLRRGDILLFRRDSGEYLLHRVAKAEPGKLVMNGDSQAWTEAIRPEQVLAAVSHIRRKGKLISCRRWDYRLYTFLWQAMRPVRPLLFRGYSRMKRPKGTV